MNGRRTVCIKQACELADVSRRTIYNWIKDGKVDYIRTAGGSIRIFTDSLFKTPPPPAPAATAMPTFPQGPLFTPGERALLTGKTGWS